MSGSAFPSSLQISLAVVLLMGALAYWRSDNRLSVILIASACAMWYVMQQEKLTIPSSSSKESARGDDDSLASHYLGRGTINRGRLNPEDGCTLNNPIRGNHGSLKLRYELFSMISRLGVDRAKRLSLCCPQRLQIAIDSADAFFGAADGILVMKNKKRGKRKQYLYMQTLRDMRNGALNAFHGMHFVLQNSKDIKFLHTVVKALRMETLNTMIAVVSSFGGITESTTSTPISTILGAALPLDHTYDGREPF